ncbi:hypothetical protein JCM33374_g5762 [Metschnikowia sp. JCM 33374]|nr:hypothetical protein JCM33374_g5762 [Metschnikowia sp. JCM 33374]
MIYETIQHFLPSTYSFLENTGIKTQLLEILKLGHVPNHVAFIMDGNRRYAKERNLPVTEGHKAGSKALIETLETCFEIGIKEISVYAFSIENFNRPKKEVDDIHHLLKENLWRINERTMIQKQNVRLRVVGNRNLISPDILEDMERLEKESNTEKSTKVLNICFAYTSRDEIAHSIQEITAKRESKPMTRNDISERVIAENLYVDGTQPVDVLIRTSGHMRLSDFLLWQCTANCKIVFLETLWPSLNFWNLYSIFLKWKFEQSTIYSRSFLWGFPNSPKSVDLQMLPPCPPFATVTKETKVSGN